MRLDADSNRTAIVVCGLLCCVIGCSEPGKKPKADKDAKKDAVAKAASKDDDQKIDISPVKGEDAKAATPDKPADPITAPPGADTGKVILGDPELTDGIPGGGELTMEQITAWLADPKTNEVLLIELPVGLDSGVQNIKGLKENPLTRGKIELGRQLYFDKRLSSDNTVSCASCHDPEQGYAAHTQFGVGVRGQTGGRNSPVAYNRILSDKQFWDGRAGSLEDQAIGPIANPIEMANTHEKAVETVKGIPGYVAQFDKVFEGKDGSAVTIENIGKAIASFERVLVTSPAPYDYNEKLRSYGEVDEAELEKDDPDLYAEYRKAKALAETHKMSDSAKRGRDIFFADAKGGCTACHVGANLSDELYHNLGVGMEATEPDHGLFVHSKDEKHKGAFKTPTIRNVAKSAPYMHDGSQKTLEEVVEWYAKGGYANASLDPKIKKLELSDQDKKDLVEFMKACSSDFPVVEKFRLPQ
jgi:cytochrome c peroxidase